MNSGERPSRILYHRFIPGGPESQLDILEQAGASGVVSVIVIVSEAVRENEYLTLIRRSREGVSDVRSIFMLEEHMGDVDFLLDVASEIGSAGEAGYLLLISYGTSLAPEALTAYLVSIGFSNQAARSQVKMIHREPSPHINNALTIIEEEYRVSHAGEKDARAVMLTHALEHIGPSALTEKEVVRDAVPVARDESPEPTVDDLSGEVLEESVHEEEFVAFEEMEGEEFVPSGRPETQKPEEAESAEPEQVKDEIPAGEAETIDLEEAPEIQISPVVKESPEKPGTREPEPEEIIPETGDRKREKKKRKKKDKKKEIPDLPEEGLPAGEEPLPDLDMSEVRPPFYRSLGFKLVSIISILIVFSLTGMIMLASYYFRADNEARLQENNLKLSDVVASKVLSEIEKNRIVARGMLSERTGQGIINPEKSDIVYSSIVRKKGEELAATRYFNIPIMGELQLTEEMILESLQQVSSSLNRAFMGESVMLNLSGHLGEPVMAVFYPDISPDGRVEEVQVYYMRIDPLLESFETKGITTVFMVNRRGDVIAHPDIQLVLSEANLEKLPIVTSMMKSALDNQQTTYRNDEGRVFFGSFKRIELGGAGIIATVPKDIAFQAVEDIQRRNLMIMGIILTAAIMVVFFFGRSISRPVVRLVQATTRIMRGDFRVNIKASTKDEIGTLTRSFVEMGRGLEEREKMKDAFGKFVNRELAEQAMKGEIKLGGERVNAAVFFSDIRSFTAISERLEPEEVVEFLNEYMTRMVRCVNDTQGVVDKYIGDAIMAIWGAPVSKGNDIENAINGALMMRKELVEFNQGRGDEKKPLIKIGCGINYGPVLAGQIGSEDRMEYTVIGDTVNLASRIEALNKPFKTDILITEEAYSYVKDIFDVEPMKSIKVKGKAEPQQIYAVIGRKDDPEKPADMGELRRILGWDDMPVEMSDEELEDSETKYEIIQ
jgi:adenylate cyclase